MERARGCRLGRRTLRLAVGNYVDKRPLAIGCSAEWRSLMVTRLTTSRVNGEDRDEEKLGQMVGRLCGTVRHVRPR